MTRSVSVVVPVYNAQESLRELIARLRASLEGSVYEIVLVNDGSADASWQEIEAIAREHPQVRGLDLARNYGQHNALLAGIRAARNDIVVTLDDDLQNPPEEIPRLLGRLDGLDVVYGTPREVQHGLWRNFGTRIAKAALRPALGRDVARHVSAFRAFRRDLRDAFEAFSGPHVSIDALLSWSTTRVGWVEVAHDERRTGRSSYTFRRLASHALTMLTAFSTRPLRAASLLGLLSTFFGIGILVLVVVRYFTSGGSVPGFPFLAAIIAIFSGAQLLTLGVIGEYLARMHERSMSRPPFAVRRDTDEEERVGGD